MNQEHVKKILAQYNKHSESVRKWNRANPECIKKSSKKYRANHAEQCRQKVREWRARKKIVQTLEIKISIDEEFLKTLNL